MNYKLVKVFWKDITGKDGVEAKEIPTNALISFVSVGFLVGKGKDGKIRFLRIANKLRTSEHGDSADETFDIPLGCIEKIQYL